MRLIMPCLILLTSAIYIFAIPDNPFAVKLLFKLIPMWLIIAYACLQFPQKRKRSHWLLLSGLFFCMLGDGLLVWFIVGLAAFLIGHLFYLFTFVSVWRYSLLRLLTIIPLSLYGVLMASRLLPAVKAGGDDALVIPVLIYLIVISLMCWAAIMTGNKLAMWGSILFVISDSVLAWNMFVSDIAHSSIYIMTTYYGAQFLIARSARNIASP
ncbi:lysoplasmalogenase [Paenibacillus radicis (ex Gao et al. 2016)]|uniref:Lysoplasmalogenase n=1 Tax=Paenibacillus radicis (ex Gao et al. 2016) TaxID=1737354 RepID=A0A917HBA1_9BACL|nr:lysoplasmalogenase [Paenibacillus radicis (ex Gao et al. 2016)]GGG73045.1 lysoplasmalogenase [Paenibacillus radicis (ex Gao et al. 2016)]